MVCSWLLFLLASPLLVKCQRNFCHADVGCRGAGTIPPQYAPGYGRRPNLAIAIARARLRYPGSRDSNLSSRPIATSGPTTRLRTAGYRSSLRFPLESQHLSDSQHSRLNATQESVGVLGGGWGTFKRGHPVTRWSDSLNKFFTQVHKDKTTVTDGNAFWMALAEDRDNWVSLTEDFVNFAMGR